MLIEASSPTLANQKIPNFPYDYPFVHQLQFYQNRDKDIILKSPTCSGKTDAFLFSFINEYLSQGNAQKM